MNFYVTVILSEHNRSNFKTSQNNVKPAEFMFPNEIFYPERITIYWELCQIVITRKIEFFCGEVKIGLESNR